jgi:hypothetical protein
MTVGVPSTPEVARLHHSPPHPSRRCRPMLVRAGGDIVARVLRTGRPRGWANSDGELGRRGLRIEGAYKLCQTYFVQINLAELLVSLRNWRRTFRPSQEPAGKTRMHLLTSSTTGKLICSMCSGRVNSGYQFMRHEMMRSKLQWIGKLHMLSYQKQNATDRNTRL